MATLAAHGIDVALPAGWDGRIAVRADGAPEPVVSASGTHVATLRARPVAHFANFGLPAERGDFGSGAVELMGDQDVFVVLFEYEPAAAQTALFRDRRPPARSSSPGTSTRPPSAAASPVRAPIRPSSGSPVVPSACTSSSARTPGGRGWCRS